MQRNINLHIKMEKTKNFACEIIESKSSLKDIINKVTLLSCDEQCNIYNTYKNQLHIVERLHLKDYQLLASPSFMEDTKLQFETNIEKYLHTVRTALTLFYISQKA